jgi:Double zinc ribbon
MVLLVSLFLLLTLGAIAYPFLAPPRTRVASRTGEAEELAQERESALAAIRDLEFEYSVGNLSDDDFAALRDQDTERAAKILARLDRLPVVAPSPDEEDETAEDDEQIVGYCAACDEPVAPENRHCGACGAFLFEATCPGCHSPLDENDRFCSRCGEKVEAA